MRTLLDQAGILEGNSAEDSGPPAHQVATSRCTNPLDQDVVDNVPVNIGQPVIPTAVPISQTLMIQTHQMQNRRMEIVHMHSFVNSVPTEIVRSTVRHPTTNPTPAIHMVNPNG